MDDVQDVTLVCGTCARTRTMRAEDWERHRQRRSGNRNGDTL